MTLNFSPSLHSSLSVLSVWLCCYAGTSDVPDTNDFKANEPASAGIGSGSYPENFRLLGSAILEELCAWGICKFTHAASVFSGFVYFLDR